MENRHIFSRSVARYEDTAIRFIFLAGIILSVWQFLFNRSLWLDEASLALNIIHRNFIDLLHPLDYNQVAPVLFLMIEKLFTLIIPDSEFGLRLFPLICYWLSLYFFYRILRISFENSFPIILSLSLFVFNSMLIYYASEVKQYMCDVLVTTSMLYLLLKDYEKPVKKYILLCSWGTVSIFLSNITAVILTACVLFFLYELFIRKKKEMRMALMTSTLWLSAFFAYYFLFIHDHPTRNMMITYWTNQKAFLPVHVFDPAFVNFISTHSRRLSNSILQHHLFKFQFPILLMFGFVAAILRKKTALAFLLLLPVVIHLVLSAMKLYPFDQRFILYGFPLFIILISFLADYLFKLMSPRVKLTVSVVFAIIFPITMIFALLHKGFPRQKEEIKKSIQYIQQHLSNEDNIYVYKRGTRAFSYYQNIGFVDYKEQVTLGTTYVEKQTAFLNEIMPLRGRTWILLSHTLPEEELHLKELLKSKGIQPLDSFQVKGSGVKLYNFGEDPATIQIGRPLIESIDN